MTYSFDCEGKAFTVLKTSPLQSHLGRVCRYPHVRECTLQLHVLAVACTT